MHLCLDVGNSTIHGGVYDDEENLRVQFRRSTHPVGSSDELGLFLRGVLRENSMDPALVHRVAICSVVPAVVYPLRAASVKYFAHEPFILQPGVKTGLRIKYRNPQEVGPDRIASAVAAAHLYRDRDVIVIDCGTAMTFDVLTAGRDYLGGCILPGLAISVDALAGKTARLPAVEIARPVHVLGRSTIESIQAGVFFGQIGAIRELTTRLQEEVFEGRRPLVLGTGGFSRVFEGEKLFDDVVPDLVLRGLHIASALNVEGTIA